jgi:hypothetical protein
MGLLRFLGGLAVTALTSSSDGGGRSVPTDADLVEWLVGEWQAWRPDSRVEGVFQPWVGGVAEPFPQPSTVRTTHWHVMYVRLTLERAGAWRRDDAPDVGGSWNLVDYGQWQVANNTLHLRSHQGPSHSGTYKAATDQIDLWGLTFNPEGAP